MNSKAELLVFNKKEIIVIIVLLVLVALFSFTLGLKLGRTLGAGGQHETTEHPPLAEKVETHAANENAHAETGHAEDVSTDVAKKTAEAPAAKQLAEDHADAEFNREIDKEKIGTSKVVPMSLPKEKKAEAGKAAARFTLQVGSHRTVAEATEQVSGLKRKGLDAFYLEAKVPGKGTWYRVGIGVFGSKEEAERAAENWKPKGLPSFIIQKVGE